MNVPGKAFELVESVRHAPSLAAEEAQALLDAGEDMVILDARRFEQYQVMNIPGSVGVPGAELAHRPSTATAVPTRVPTTRPRRCRPVWTGNSAWWPGRDGVHGFRVL